MHRVVGPPGIVLVGEGNPSRLRQLLTSERRKHERVATDAPIHEIVVGNGEGQVPLPKLAQPRQQAGPQGSSPPRSPTSWPGSRRWTPTRSNIPLPKGPVPTDEGHARQNMRAAAETGF